MKKNIIITILLSLYGLCISFAQNNTNYYLESKTFTREDYTYQCDVPPYKLIKLYNKGNQLVYQDMTYKDSGNIFDGLAIEGPSDMYRKMESIINGAFTEEEAATLNVNLGITLYLNPQTGDVMEVCFDFLNQSPYSNIPVERYRDLELQLKSELKFTPSEIGRQLNFIRYYWMQIPTGVSNYIDRDLDNPTYTGEPIEP